LQTRIVSTNDPNAIPLAKEILSRHGLVAFPTDTVYGLAAGAFSFEGISRLYQAKARSALKAIAVLIGDVDQLELLTSGLPSSARQMAVHFWPGALTLVVNKRENLPENLSSMPTVGIRMPDHAFARDLLRSTGPLATSSANISGEANALNAQQVFEQLNGRVELILDGGPVPGGIPSTVVDCTQNPPTILRHGAISAEEIQQVLDDSQPTF